MSSTNRIPAAPSGSIAAAGSLQPHHHPGPEFAASLSEVDPSAAYIAHVANDEVEVDDDADDEGAFGTGGPYNAHSSRSILVGAQQDAEEYQMLSQPEHAPHPYQHPYHGMSKTMADTQRYVTTDSSAPLLSALRPNRLSLVANRVLFSTAYTVLYMLCMTLAVFLLVWFILKGQTVHDHPWYMALDLIATCGLFIEVLLRYVAKPTGFFKQPLNILDLMILVLVVGGTLLYFTAALGAELSSVALIVRYTAQLSRLLVLMHRHRQRLLMMSASESDVTIQPLDEEEREAEPYLER